MKSLKDFVDDAKSRIREVTPEEAEALRQAGGWTVLDVREPEEYVAGHLPGAINVPRGFLEVKADLEHYKRDPQLSDRAQPILCYCGGGHRSALAADTLQQMGFENVVSVAEGWTGWIGRNLPTEL